LGIGSYNLFLSLLLNRSRIICLSLYLIILFILFGLVSILGLLFPYFSISLKFLSFFLLFLLSLLPGLLLKCFQPLTMSQQNRIDFLFIHSSLFGQDGICTKGLFGIDTRNKGFFFWLTDGFVGTSTEHDALVVSDVVLGSFKIHGKMKLGCYK